MIRDLFIIAIIIICVIIGTIYTQNLLGENTEILLADLENLQKDINSNIEKEEINNNANEIYRKWREISEKWSVIVDHQEIDLIEKALISVKSTIETEEYKRSIQKIEESTYLIEKIKDKEELNIKNIF